MKETLPITQKERVTIVDVIRGFALVGVLIANFTSYVDQQTPVPVLNSISSSFDRFLMNFNSVFLEWKFMTLFSILFGYGFGLILENVEKKNINPNFFFVKRMFWLFLFGVIHCIFWWGDVLNLYAISGILLLLFRKKSNSTILFFSMIFMFVLPVFISYLLRNRPETFTETDIVGLYNQYKNGTLIEVIKFNINFYYRMYIVSGGNYHDITQTLGRFLFGYFLLRIKFFHSAETKGSTYKKIALYAAPVMVGYFIFRWLLIQETIHINQYFSSLVQSVGVLSTTTFYVCILVIAYISFGMNRFFALFQALGRMTLTNYLMVSAFLIILLYGFGFNRLGELPVRIIWLYAFGWLIVEILISIYWLRKFRYGPTEWIWRQLTYWKRLKLRK